jgi:putative phosphotransacetylase
MAPTLQIPVALSGRHCHLSRADIETLFGPSHELHPQKPLSQPGQFAAEEAVEVVGPKGSIPGVRVLGPARSDSQVELSITDGYVLGVPLPVRVSGDVLSTPGGHLIGPRGAVRLDQGLIVAARHIHLEPAHAVAAGLQDQQRVAVRALGKRGLIFEEVVIRVSDKFKTEMHLDTDEGNAAAVRNGDLVEVIADVCALCPTESCAIREDPTQPPSRPYCDFTQTQYRVL